MMKAVLLLLLVSPLALCDSEPQREALLFNQADKDQDGQLTPDDLKVIFLDFDTNDDGEVGEAEFVADWTTVFQLGNAEEAKTLFDKADTNDDNVVNDQDLAAIFTYFDMDGNGLVDMNEFLTQWGDLRLNAPDTVVISPDN